VPLLLWVASKYGAKPARGLTATIATVTNSDA
jgi:hypothetical protein